jgi:hypothetical protein
MAKEKKINLGKAEQVLSKTFCDNHKEISEDEAADLIVKAEMRAKALKEERDNDEKLKAAKQIVADLGSGYKAAIDYEKAKIDFLLDRISEIQNDEVNPESSLKGR